MALTIRACLHHRGLPRLENRLLLEHVLQKPHGWLIAHDDETLSDTHWQQLQTLVARREAGEPMAYLLGFRGFLDFVVRVTPDVLIPRPETELLVETALTHLVDQHTPRVLDLGTGSGIVAIAIARALPHAQVIATDVSAPALAVAQHNAQALDAEVTFLQSDWYDALSEMPPFDMVVSNPPYIHGEDEHLTTGDLRHEPRMALTDEKDGLTDIGQIVVGARAHLKPGGWLWMEHGYDQGSAVRQILNEAGFVNVSTHRDLANHERVSGGIAPVA